jgi:hypothetical protein
MPLGIKLLLMSMTRDLIYVLFDRKRPSFLEFYSYVFQFSSLLCGPLVFYNDYIEFIEGKNFTRHIESSSTRTKIPSPRVRMSTHFYSFSHSYLP